MFVYTDSIYVILYAEKCLCQTLCDFVKGMLTCLDRFNNNMHVHVFIFGQAHGKGSAHREQHRDGLVEEGFWRLGPWSAFRLGSKEAGSACVHMWGIADPTTQVS